MENAANSQVTPSASAHPGRTSFKDKYLKKTWQKVLTGMAAVAVFCTSYMLVVPAITLANPFCGLEEHEHDASCYTTELTCPLPELTEDEARAARAAGDEQAVAHRHTDACYDEVTICDKKAHTHTLACYADADADVEDAKAWFDSFASVTAQTDLGKADAIAQIALTQAGYAESEHNYEVVKDDQGNEAKAGYTRYGAWYNAVKPVEDGASHLYDNWDALFAAFCLENAGAATLPSLSFNSDTQTWLDALLASDKANIRPASQGVFAVGDIVFWEQDLRQPDGSTTPVTAAAVVAKAENNQLQLLAGNAIDGNRDVVKKYNDVAFNDARLLYALTVVEPEEPAASAQEAEADAAAPTESEADAATEVTDPVESDAEGTAADEASAGNAQGRHSANAASGAEAWLTEASELSLLPENIKQTNVPLKAPLFAAKAPMADQAPLKAAGDSSLSDSNPGVDVAQYLTPSREEGIVVLYRVPGKDTEWQRIKDIEPGTVIPANVEARIEVKYAGIDPKDLQENSYTLYLLTESGIKDLIAEADVYIAGEKRGVLNADQDSVNLVLDKNFIDAVCAQNAGREGTAAYRYLTGNFFFQGTLDLKSISEGGGTQLKFSGVTIDIPTEGDAIAKYADVDAVKSANGGLIKGDDGHWYLEYAMTVTAGEYGSPAVSVLDTVTTPNYVEGYVGVTGTPTAADFARDASQHPVDSLFVYPGPGDVYLTSAEQPLDNDHLVEGRRYAPDENGNKMVWEIGDMGAYESRTLTYRVRVKDEYVGIPHDTTSAIDNKVETFSKQYPHGADTDQYIPEARTELTKSVTAGPELGDDGLYHITYKVRVTADANNVYPLDNMKVRDDLDDARNNGYRDKQMYVKDSLKLYRDADLTDEITDLAQYHSGARSGYEGEANPYFAEDGNAFELYVGALEPGESRWVTYEMTLNADEAQMAVNGQVGFFNTAESYADDTRSTPMLNRAQTAHTVSSQTWERKLASVLMREAEVVQVPTGAKVYDATTGSTDTPLPEITGPVSYEIPVGAFKYSVVINEDGQWNMSSSNWQDTLGESRASDGQNYHMLKFIDYVRVDVYDSVPASGNQATLERNLADKTPKDSIWVKIDDLWSYAFSGSQIGLENETDAYVLTYYAKQPTSGVPSFGQVNVGNTFGVSGQVIGPNGNPYTLGGIQSSVTTSVSEPGVNAPCKASWYYDPSDRVFENYAEKDEEGKTIINGAQYWIIKMTGDKIPKGAKFQESTRIGELDTFMRNGESFLGFYVIDFGEGYDMQNSVTEFTERYKNFDEFESAAQDPQQDFIHEVPAEYYNATWREFPNEASLGRGSNWDLNFEFTRDYAIGATESLYMLVRTDPVVMPKEGSAHTYTNKVNFKPNDQGSWSYPQASHTIIGSKGKLKKGTDGTFIVSDNGTKFKHYSDDVKAFTDYPDATKTGVSNATLPGRMICVDKDFKAVGKPAGSFQDTQGTYTYKDGVYVVWTLTANSAGKMVNSGPYVIEDTLPEGVELAYVRASGVGDNTNPNSQLSPYDIPQAQRPTWDTYKPETIIARQNPQWVEEGWTEHRVAAANKMDMNWNRVGTYYYTDTATNEAAKKVRLHIENIANSNPLEFQVVCRVTDPNIYFHDVELTNTASMSTPEGVSVESDSSTVSVHTPGVGKELLISSSETLTGTKTLPFQIIVNDIPADMQEPIDMDPEGDWIHIPLLDHLSPNLMFNTESLRIYLDSYDPADPEKNLMYSGATKDDGTPIGNTNTPEIKAALNLGPDEETNIRVALEKYVDENGQSDGSQQIRFYEFPDERTIVIRYNVTADLKPGDGGNAISNSAYWEGGDVPEGSDITLPEFKYEAGAQAQLVSHPAIRISKYAGSDVTDRLSGATFAMYGAKYKMEGGKLVLDLDEEGNAQLDLTTGSAERTRVTDENGLIVYGLDKTETAVNNLHFNIVYGGMEIEAPEGYDIDPTQHFFVFPNESPMLERGDFPYPEGGKWPDNVYVVTDYVGDIPTYDLGVANYKGTAQVAKDFGGNNPSYKAGSYNFGIWAEVDMPKGKDGTVSETSLPDPSTMLDSKTITYTEADFEYDEDGKAVGLKDAPKVATFTDLTIGKNYYIFELNKSGYPIQHESSATFGTDESEERYFVEYSAEGGAYAKAYQLAYPGSPGTYSVGIQKMLEDGSWEEVNPNKVVHLEWQAGDTEASKNACFSGLEFGTTYRIVLLAEDRKTPVGDALETIVMPQDEKGELPSGVFTTPNMVMPTKDEGGKPVVPKMTTSNSGYAAKATKSFMHAGADRQEMEKGIAGSYTFGIQRMQNDGTWTAVEATRTLEWTEDITEAKQTVVFDSLEPDTTYRISEVVKVDGAWKVLAEGDVFGDDAGHTFVVHYNPDNQEFATTEDAVTETTISNQTTVELPATGGRGTSLFTTGGLLLLAAGLVGGFLQRRRCERREKV